MFQTLLLKMLKSLTGSKTLQVGGQMIIISENEFVTGIEYLINNNIILLDFVPCNDETQSQYGDTKSIPDWIKNNANWWSENLINDTDFINGSTIFD